MSDIKSILADVFSKIANAIREKTGSLSLIKPSDMPQEIKMFVTSDDAKTLINATFNKDYGVGKDVIIPGYIGTITTTHVLNGMNCKNLTISEGITELSAYFATNAIVSGDLYLPKSLTKIGTSALDTVSLRKCNIYYNNTLENFLKLNTLSGGAANGIIFYGEFIQFTKKAYFKDENDNWIDVFKKNPIVKVTNDIVGKYSFKYFPFELDFSEISNLPDFCCLSYGMLYLTYSKDLSKDVILNENITSLGKQCFRTASIKNLYINTNAINTNKSSSDGSFYQAYIQKLVFGDAVTGIGNYQFRDVTIYDSQITIPENITSIGTSSLILKIRSDYNEKYVLYFLSKIPCSIQTSSFEKSTLNKIYVPKNCASVYKNATNWSTFADYIFEPNTVTVSIPSELLNNEKYTYSIDGGEMQQFTASSLTFENIATFKIKNSGDVTINVGTTNGGTEIGSVGTGAELLYATESDTTIYLTIQA